MKKITFTLLTLVVALGMSAQTYSTGTVTMFPDYSVKIDVTSATVTLTMIGPDTSWLGLAFDSSGMNSIGSDCVIFDGTSQTDRTFNGIGAVPPLDAIQNWTVSSNTVTAGVRTVISSRARDTGDPNDYAFSASAQSINLTYARSLGSLAIGYHGGGNCGAVPVNFNLGTDDFAAKSFNMYPNPAKGFTNLELPTTVNSGEVKMYDSLGRVVKKQTLNSNENTINTSDLPSGSYLVVVRTDYGNSTKTLVVE